MEEFATLVRYGDHRPPPPGASCEACGAGPHGLVNDHCHKHGWVRGTLCRTCNARMTMLDGGVTANGDAVDELLAIAGRCPECPPISAADLAPAPGGRGGLVRTTCDLEPELYASLKAWTTQQGITIADLIRQLAREARDDVTLRARVEAEIEARQARVREAQRLAQE
jgi:hypothetical protein